MCNILADFVCAPCSDSEELLCREAVVPEPEDDDEAGKTVITSSIEMSMYVEYKGNGRYYTAAIINCYHINKGVQRY